MTQNHSESVPLSPLLPGIWCPNDLLVVKAPTLWIVLLQSKVIIGVLFNHSFSTHLPTFGDKFCRATINKHAWTYFYLATMIFSGEFIPLYPFCSNFLERGPIEHTSASQWVKQLFHIRQGVRRHLGGDGGGGVIQVYTIEPATHMIPPFVLPEAVQTHMGQLLKVTFRSPYCLLLIAAVCGFAATSSVHSLLEVVLIPPEYSSSLNRRKPSRSSMLWTCQQSTGPRCAATL
ncbi:hypothetical protein DFS33DRAFT_1274510 [Desarmillaria ectypa]|nr:hypothetical protein DFS33DRAFT_1274510 [Desarmillaria ectypa]